MEEPEFVWVLVAGVVGEMDVVLPFVFFREYEKQFVGNRE
ncbi:hypothetical protein CCA_00646 [Chlamydia caviae GPIC]|uniref:Uncharacterized protein n=1 Tax=Chlamydia caviae (strain ATCC VR-813 / DSM 19441 / 03DC25 / GPIC) TaxID=227941 RepID=Q822N5_CHLCV|nr:hypothetical protein CCA_00646 [Chlamydia caviae GPIC]